MIMLTASTVSMKPGGLGISAACFGFLKVKDHFFRVAIINLEEK
jgi:hypothetical protein